MTTKKSRAELLSEYGKRIGDRYLGVRSALNKAVERDVTILDAVVRDKSPSEALTVLNRMVEDENSDFAKNNTQNKFLVTGYGHRRVRI